MVLQQGFFFFATKGDFLRFFAVIVRKNLSFHDYLSMYLFPVASTRSNRGVMLRGAMHGISEAKFL